MSCLNAWQRAVMTVAIAFPIAASAQSKPDDPTDPSMTSSAAPYRSVFFDYQPYQEVELIPWRKSNDDVGQAAGDGGHNMGSMSSEMPPAENTKTAPTPAHDMSKMGSPKKAKE